MPSSTTECGKLEPASGIVRGELRSTWAERAFAEIGVVSGRENFRRNCRCRRDYPDVNFMEDTKKADTGDF